MNTSYIALLPRDGLFCKDGRGWHTSESGRGHSLDWPWPTTILGALRTAWGRANGDNWKAAEAIKLGRSLAVRRKLGSRSWSTANRVWPSPADALFARGADNVLRLDPVRTERVRHTLGLDPTGLSERLWFPLLSDSAKPVSAPRWWSEEAFIQWLAGEAVAVSTARAIDSPKRRMQTHVGIDPKTYAAAESILFAHDVVETMDRSHEWGIAAEVTGQDLRAVRRATLGADGRLALVENVAPACFDAEAGSAVRKAFQEKQKLLRIVVVTPTLFHHGWLPDGFEANGDRFVGALPGMPTLVLRSAFVGRPMAISGWDMVKRQPKPTRRLVPPGAVYLFEREHGEAFDETHFDALWMRAIGGSTDEGFGRIVPGVGFSKEAVV